MVGAPTALLRLSVVGNVGYELQSVGIAADAFGTTASAATLTPGIFQTTVFLMAFGCIGYLVIPALLCTKMDKVIRKISGKGRNRGNYYFNCSDSGLLRICGCPLHTGKWMRPQWRWRGDSR